MNPRIMKKLSKRIAVHAEALGYNIDLDGPCAVELTEKGTSRKIWLFGISCVSPDSLLESESGLSCGF